MRLPLRSALLVLLTVLIPLAAPAEDLAAPADPALAFTGDGPDTLRTNLWVAEALMGKAVQSILDQLPPPPAAIVLVPADTEQPASLLTSVATHHLQAAGYSVHLDQAPEGTERTVLELRFRVEDLALTYPASGRRLGLWKSWVDRQMDLAVQITVVDSADGQVVVSRRVARRFQDRVPVGYMDAIESDVYAFTSAEEQASGWSRRLEEIVVVGALAGLVAIYFGNTE